MIIKDDQGNNIPVANVLLKEKSSNEIGEFYRVFQGDGTYVIKKKYVSILLEIQSTNYASEEINIINPNPEEEYFFNVVLKSKEVELKEVIVEGKELPYKIKKDTIVFDISKYTDGSEKKVEDVIKKLPGVEVDANGSIKYKGKSIETVTLDGDNLFNSNYKLGTKNINIDMVEQIEAIDNYTNNKLLKGIESEGKVALNLKLKKGKSDFSGSLENGLGFKNDLNGAFYSNSYVMQISSKVKSFTTLNLNNIGRSDAYFYEKQSSKSLDRKSDEDFQTQKIITSDIVSPQLDPIRYNRNNQLFVSHNNLFKVNQKTTFKTNFNFIDDKINSKQDISTKNFINNTTIETNDTYSFIKKPKVFTGELEFRLNTTKSTLFEVYSKQYIEKTKLFSTYVKNNNNEFNNNNTTNSYFSINKIVHTWKVSNNNALQGNIYYTFNKIPQYFTSNSIDESFTQKSSFRKSIFLFNYNLIGKTNKISYTSQIGGNLEKTPYASENSIDNNDILFRNNFFYNHSRIKINIKQFVIAPSISLTDYDFSLSDKNNYSDLKKNVVIVEPSLDLIYSFRKSTFRTFYSYTQKPISEENIFSDRVFINNRTTIQNIPSFDFKRTNGFGVFYFYNNLFKNKTLSVSSRYEKSNGQYLSSYSIDEEFIRINKSFYHAENSVFTNNIRYSSFIEKLSSTIIVSSSYVENKYPNFVNSNDIRKNTNYVFKNSLDFRTGFNSKVNFEETIDYSTVVSKYIIKNQVNSFKNTFKVRYKINKKINGNIKWDSYIPNLDNKNNNYNFLDFECYYAITKKLNFIFLANNLLNINSYKEFDNTDFSTYNSEINLTQRFFLLNVEYNF
ncbi:hypothetical protein GOQ30_06220 [Flavobacterium sp. TP390]|uniref:Outer membrane protein beta-barrel domain-containing protein n=1 Tax=Flavobacterium profundi TaxID=1774945 RepID=A0A6I4IGK9_9FLAO|nr:hypothetical protein [Flavobacterium profundi]MVO08758.1 hypothetical protein [Flavobacterium profundi]